jgi:hypothetical protein
MFSNQLPSKIWWGGGGIRPSCIYKGERGNQVTTESIISYTHRLAWREETLERGNNLLLVAKCDSRHDYSLQQNRHSRSQQSEAHAYNSSSSSSTGATAHNEPCYPLVSILWLSSKISNSHCLEIFSDRMQPPDGRSAYSSSVLWFTSS